MASRNTLLAALLAAALAFAFLGTRPLWEPDEGRYSNVALEMIRLDDWLIPHLHHEVPHFTKPPLTYWAVAASLEAFGRHAWAARLPSALAYLGVALVLLALGRRLVPERPWLPAVVYATMPLPFVAANVITTDSLLAFCTGLAGAGFTVWLLDERAPRGAVFLMWLGFGLAFLTKGPPGLLALPAFVVTAGLVRGRRGLASILNPGAVAVFLVVGFTWFAVLVARDRSLIRYFLVDETAKRVATGMHHRNSEWYAWLTVYGPTLLLGTLPWTASFLRAVRRVGRVVVALARRRARDADRLDLALTLWLLIPLAVFVLSRSRLAFYLLPLFMPLAVLTAREVGAGFLARARSRAFFGAWVVALLAVKLGATFVPAPREDVPALAASLRAAATGPVREVVCVERRPVYGLHFYLDAEVEAVTMAATGDDRQSLADELGEDEPGRIFVVRDGDADRFKAAVRGQGWMPVARGGSDGVQYFEVAGGTP